MTVNRWLEAAPVQQMLQLKPKIVAKLESPFRARNQLTIGVPFLPLHDDIECLLGQIGAGLIVSCDGAFGFLVLARKLFFPFFKLSVRTLVSQIESISRLMSSP